MMTRLKIRTILIFGVTVALASMLFHVSQRVQTLEDKRAALEGDISETTYNTHVLRAEWAHLTSPQNLQYLADKYLDLDMPRSDALLSQSDISGVMSPPRSGEGINDLDGAYNNGTLLRPISAKRGQ